MVPQENLTPWHFDAPPRPPSPFLMEALFRLRVFDLTNSEAAKILLIDALLAEIVPEHPGLKIWKAALLESETLTGVADYLIARDRAYLASPLLCAVEAKRDDFDQGRAQCLGEMVACAQNNLQEGYDLDVFGIVSNGQGWQFYKLTRAGEIFESVLYAASDLPRLLGILDDVCAACARMAP